MASPNPNPFNNPATRLFSRKLYLSQKDNAASIVSATPTFFLRQADTTSYILLASGGGDRLMRAEV